ncbi:hypothetical protein [Candidatus Borrarchaeum sp.]|uniref:hypothetical protein n=1 Tax=Candidatus Borrarchaeum sp. TaxID=2846742 RepID=UPI00257ADA9E|nr:hypothetical protein [Candidatus Borrarchaeum sp.]
MRCAFYFFTFTVGMASCYVLDSHLFLGNQYIRELPTNEAVGFVKRVGFLASFR